MLKEREARTTVLVAGGGPAGSMAATLLAREGIDVTLCEREKFPRYHIGESLLTSAIPLLEFVDVHERVAAHGFVVKYGGFFRVRHGEPAGYVDFTKLSKHRHSYQVVRSEFDAILLDHARRQGVTVHEQCAVETIDFDGERPVRAHLRGEADAPQTLAFDFIIDATGLAGLLSTKYLRNRRAEPAFANVALGGYYEGARAYRDEAGKEHPGAFSMEALTDGAGWTWAIPLHDGTLSVGTVLGTQTLAERRERLGSLDAVFDDAMAASPDTTWLTEHATRVGPVRAWRDYSYFAERFAAPGFRLAGDAAGFVDPLFSSGVHMAFLGGLSAAASICSELRGELTAADSARFHHRCLSQAYTRFMVTVAGFYRQLRRQDDIVLPGITRENWQLAFDLIQPVVSGDVDVGADDIPDEVLQRTMQYTTDMMLEAHEFGTDNGVARLMVKRAFDDSVTDRLGAVDGQYIRLKRGRLGVATLGTVGSAAAGVARKLIRGVVSTLDR